MAPAHCTLLSLIWPGKDSTFVPKGTGHNAKENIVFSPHFSAKIAIVINRDPAELLLIPRTTALERRQRRRQRRVILRSRWLMR